MQDSHWIRAGWLLIVVFAVSACAVPSTEPSGNQTLRFHARVTRVDLEGGFWGLMADNGAKYDPVNLPEAFARDGLRVHVVAKPVDAASIHMWGAPVRIDAIRAIE